MLKWLDLSTFLLPHLSSFHIMCFVKHLTSILSLIRIARFAVWFLLLLMWLLCTFSFDRWCRICWVLLHMTYLCCVMETCRCLDIWCLSKVVVIKTLRFGTWHFALVFLYIEIYQQSAHVCAYYYAQLSYTIQHRTVLIVFSLYLQTVIIAQFCLSLERIYNKNYKCRKITLDTNHSKSMQNNN